MNIKKKILGITIAPVIILGLISMFLTTTMVRSAMLEEIEDGRLPEADFIELCACTQGCVGGCLTVENPYGARMRIKRLMKGLPVSRSRYDFRGGDRDLVKIDQELQYVPAFRLDQDRSVALEKLLKIDELERSLPGLDCGSCGAPTCKALAEDIVRSEADEKDCIYYLRENLHKLTEEVTIMADYLIDGENFGDEAVYVLRECVHKIADEMSRLEKNTRRTGDDLKQSD